MSKHRTSLTDIEQLSAYLDGQLNPHQRAVVEARLRAESELRTHLEGLQKTRTLLRSLPRHRAPRNFTLSPKTIGRRASSRLPAFFGAVSALSSALLILLVIGGLLLSERSQPASLPDDNQVMTVEVGAPEGEEEVLSMAQEAAAPTDTATGGEIQPSADTSRTAENTPEVALAQPVAQSPVPPDAPLVEIQGAAPATQTPSPTPAPLLEALPPHQPSPTPLPYEVALPVISAAESEEEILPEETSPKIPESTEAPATPIQTALLAGEIILSGIALLTALIALILLIRSHK